MAVRYKSRVRRRRGVRKKRRLARTTKRMRGPAYGRAQAVSRSANAYSSRPVFIRNIRPRRLLTIIDFVGTNQGITISDILSGSGTYTFRLNGPQDPWVAAGGTTPRNFNALAHYYNSYRVHGAKMSVELSQIPSGGRPARMFLVAHPASVTLPSTMGDVLELPQSRSALVPADGTSRRVSLYATTHAVFGVTKSEVNDDSGYSAAVTTVPATQAYFSLSGAKLDSVAATDITVYFTPRIRYYVEFFRPDIDEVSI